MSWIREAEGTRPGSILGVMSIIPEAMEAVRGLNHHVTFGSSTLTRVQEECIATVVSVANQCHY